MDKVHAYSSRGPICPHCGHAHRPDEPFYYDESTVSMDCESCARNFNMRVYNQTSWTTLMPEQAND